MPAAPSRLQWLLLAGILVLAAVLRFWQLDAQSMWYDEVLTLAESSGNYREFEPLESRNQWIDPPAPRPTSIERAQPLGETIGELEEQLNPPLYYLALRAWREVFGGSVAAARALSALLSLAAVGVVFEAGRRLYGVEAGLWAAAIMALAEPQITYAQEIRNYALLTLVGAGALLAMASIEESGPSWRNAAGLFLTALAMSLTHYFSLGALLALGLYGVLVLRGRARRTAIGSLAAAAGAFALIWGPTFLRQIDRASMASFLRTEESFHVLRTLGRALTVPVQNLLPTGPANSAVLMPADFVIGALVTLVPIVLLRRRRSLILPWLWLVGTVGVLVAVDVYRQTVTFRFVRYSLLAGVGVSLLLPGLFRKARFGRAALIVVTAWVGLSAYHEAYRPWKNERWNYRGIAEWVHRHVPEDGRLVFQTVPRGTVGPRGERQWLGLQRLRAVLHYEYSPRRPVMVLTRPVEPEILQPPGEDRNLWVITPPGDGPDPRLLPGFSVVDGVRTPVAGMYELMPIEEPSRTDPVRDTGPPG